MADFTINSLGASTPASTDNFLKSDSNGVLTKVPFSAIAAAIGNAPVHTVQVQSSGNVKLKIAVFNKIVVGVMTNTSESMLTADGAWHTFADVPSGVPEFSVLSLVNSNGLIKVRTRWEGNVNKLQYQTSITSGVGYYILASGATLAD